MALTKFKYNLATYFLGYIKEFMYSTFYVFRPKRTRGIETKFVILSSGRTGSTLLVNLMNNLDDVECQGELLKRRLWRPRHFIKMWEKQTLKKHFGFKILSYHIRNVQKINKEKEFLNNLTAQGYKVIYLERQNRLYQAFSLLYALSRDRWHQEKNKSIRKHKIIVDFNILDQWMRDLEELGRYEEELLEGIDYLHLVYENDLQNKKQHNRTLDKIANFLNIETQTAFSDFKKITPRKLDSFIENYDETIAYIREQPYAHFLNLTEQPSDSVCE